MISILLDETHERTMVVNIEYLMCARDYARLIYIIITFNPQTNLEMDTLQIRNLKVIRVSQKKSTYPSRSSNPTVVLFCFLLGPVLRLLTPAWGGVRGLRALPRALSKVFCRLSSVV